MNIKLTNKDLKNNFGVIVSCGYCELQTLLNMKNRVGYNKGVYGWNFDVFDFGGVGLITGYRTRGADVKLSMEFCKHWDERAKNATYEERKQILAEFERELQKLVREFVESKRKQKTRAAVERQLFDKKAELFELFKAAINEKQTRIEDGSFEKFISAVEKIVKQY